jgi:Bacterial Ig-like domain
MIRVLALLAAILAAAFAVRGSQATFTASKSNPGSSFATTANFPPALSLTAPAAAAVTNGLPTLSGAAGNSAADSATVNVKIYSGPTATGTAVQTKAVAKTAATWTWTLTTALASGTYTAQATQTDGVNTTTTAAVTFTVDATKPTATKVVAANKTGGTAGKIESGDTITYTYSEPVTAASVWSIWSGSSTNVHVRFTSAGNDTITVLDTSDAATLHLGSVATNADYVSTTTTFSATILRSADGASIIVTLGAPSNVQASANVGRNMSWTVGAGIQDLVGNAIATPATYNETNTGVDF